MNKITWLLLHLNNCKSYVIMSLLLDKTYLFNEINRWMSTYQDIKEHQNIIFLHIANDVVT